MLTAVRGLKLLVKHGVRSLSKGYADVIIVGGGMVGTALACSLGKSSAFEGKKIVLLEAAPELRKKDWKSSNFENRVSAISLGSKQLLEDIGAWKEISDRRYHAFNKMQVWDASAPGSITFNSKDIDEESIAYIIENNVIVESCTSRAQQMTSVDVSYSTKVDNIKLPSLADEIDEDLATVYLQDGQAIQTKLVLGVDGFNSFVRRSANIQTLDYDYTQSAVVATLNIEDRGDGNKTAWQCFLPTGPIALLPLCPTHSSLVWSTTKSQASELLKLEASEFVERVNEAFHETQYQHDGGFVGAEMMKTALSVLQPGRHAANRRRQPPICTDLLEASRGAFPLGLKHSPDYVRSRVALLGDAAHRVHPMAGQGVNLGFGDVSCLTRVIEETVESGVDFGCVENLLPYETERQRKAVPVLSTIHALNHLFTLAPLALTRSFGLNVVDSLPVLKNFISRQAMSS